MKVKVPAVHLLHIVFDATLCQIIYIYCVNIFNGPMWSRGLSTLYNVVFISFLSIIHYYNCINTCIYVKVCLPEINNHIYDRFFLTNVTSIF